MKNKTFIAVVLIGFFLLLLYFTKKNSGYKDSLTTDGNDNPIAIQALVSHKENNTKISLRKNSKNSNKNNNNFTCEDFEYQWNEIFRLYKSPESREIELGQLVLKMTIAGNADYALKKVADTIGEGKTRRNLIESIFSEITDPAIAEKLIGVMTADDFNAACKGTKWLVVHALEKFSSEGIACDFKKLSFLKENYHSVMTEALEQHVYEMSNNKVDARTILASLKDLNFPESILVKSLVWLSSRDAFAVNDYIQINHLKIGDKEQNSILKQMLDNDSEKAFAIINKSENVSYETKLSLIKYYLSFDSNADMSKITISDSQLKYAYFHHLAQNELQSDNITKAWDHANHINDPEIRKKVEGQIWSKERDMVRKAVNQSPQQAITDLVSGKTPHKDYWLEEAMDTWMAKDFDKAEKWYQGNWQSLPAEKSQYMAASFARRAIKSGDLDLARQWATYIRDQKTKTRIERELQNALNR